ncbi:MAG: exodeoxyribonuclease III [Pseudomonadales bacterium]
MRIVSLSVDGIAQAAGRGLFAWLAQQNADIICLQDLRASEDQLTDDCFPAGYNAYFCDRADGKRGVAIYTRQLPRAVMPGFGYSPAVDLDGTYLRADFEQWSVVSLLVPPAVANPQSLERRMRFLDNLQDHFKKIGARRRRYIFCCNWQMVHQKADVQQWEVHQADPGFMPFEREWLNSLYSDHGYVDALRAVNAERDIFSWWPSGSVGQGDGWRVDAQVVSPDFFHHVHRVRYCKEAVFSSHIPVVVDYDLDIY